MASLILVAGGSPAAAAQPTGPVHPGVRLVPGTRPSQPDLAGAILGSGSRYGAGSCGVSNEPSMSSIR